MSNEHWTTQGVFFCLELFTEGVPIQKKVGEYRYKLTCGPDHLLVKIMTTYLLLYDIEF